MCQINDRYMIKCDVQGQKLLFLEIGAIYLSFTKKHLMAFELIPQGQLRF